MTAAVTVAALSLTAGCGALDLRHGHGAADAISTPKAPKPSASKLYAQTRKAALAAKSVHVKGTITFEGRRAAFDVIGRVDGTSQQMTIQLPKEGTITIRTVGHSSWGIADRTYWVHELGASAADRFAGRYVRLDAADVKAFQAWNLRQLLTAMFGVRELSFWESIGTAVIDSDVDGTPAYRLEDKQHPDAQVFVSSDGQANLLRLVASDKKPLDLRFSGWNLIPAFRPPPAGMVVRR